MDKTISDIWLAIAELRREVADLQAELANAQKKECYFEWYENTPFVPLYEEVIPNEPDGNGG